MSGNTKNELFETMPIARAMAKLCIPTILSSLVMIFYNIADTYFIGYLNDPVQNAAVALGAPLMLAFNCINNLFGIGGSSVMSRALGAGDEDTVRKSSAFGVYGAVLLGLLLSLSYLLFSGMFLKLLGADSITGVQTAKYLFWTVGLGAAPAIFNVVMAYFVRSEGSALHASIGTMSGCILNIILDPIFIMPWGFDMGAAGAGCATFISNCAAAVYFLVYIRVRRGKYRLHRSRDGGGGRCLRGGLRGRGRGFGCPGLFRHRPGHPACLQIDHQGSRLRIGQKREKLLRQRRCQQPKGKGADNGRCPGPKGLLLQIHRDPPSHQK